MYWFADMEARIDAGTIDVTKLLRAADKNWLKVEDAKVFMEERRNDGAWLRAWLRAVVDLQTGR